MTNRTQKIVVGVVIAIFVALALGGILVGGFVYGWKSSMRQGNEAVARQHLKTIATVETEYYNTHSKTFGTLEQLVSEGMLTFKPTDDGYLFNLKIIPATSNQTSSYTLNADPEDGTPGVNHFYIDSTGRTIHVNPDQPAAASDPPVGQ